MADWPGSVDELSALERDSLVAFVGSCAPLFDRKTVLDYGCGRQPYREIVMTYGGSYHPFDRAGLPGGSGGDVGSTDGRYGVVLCTQVIEYVEAPLRLLDRLHDHLAPGGHLILTGPTSWIEPPGHLQNFTLEGIGRLLTQAGFEPVRLESRGHVGPGFSLGYGAVAQIKPER